MVSILYNGDLLILLKRSQLTLLIKILEGNEATVNFLTRNRPNISLFLVFPSVNSTFVNAYAVDPS